MSFTRCIYDDDAGWEKFKDIIETRSLQLILKGRLKRVVIDEDFARKN